MADFLIDFWPLIAILVGLVVWKVAEEGVRRR
jgi:hypothetical protein